MVEIPKDFIEFNRIGQSVKDVIEVILGLLIFYNSNVTTICFLPFLNKKRRHAMRSLSTFSSLKSYIVK